MKFRLLELDPYLKDYENDINLRMENYTRVRKELVGKKSLIEAARNHEYYGFHQADGGWYYRENAPGADEMYLVGDFNGWDRFTHRMERKKNGDFEIFIPGKNSLYNGCNVQALVYSHGRALERIPVYADYVVQDKETHQWCAQIFAPEKKYHWRKRVFHPSESLLIYECHIGMAQDKFGVGTYNEFTKKVLPRIHELGYNAIQIMAIAEHPYYGSFGYQVSNFFAPSSRFGTPDDLRNLIDTAHELGITVLLDLVHSHLVKNTHEGIAEFDGTDCQFSPHGKKGNHPAWGTRLFDYANQRTQHLLLSNLRYWMEEYHFDGFRFDGVTSMLYHNHGLGQDFDNYKKYFSLNTNTDAVTYLQLANELVHELNPEAITIAEDTSAMPGLALPIKDGGIGFDYRMAMGEPDFWIKTLKEKTDENWDIWQIWHEMTTRRVGEKVVGYVESHDQALVGDKTIMFRLCDKDMYWNMEKTKNNLVVDRGIALHKMLRLLTLGSGGNAYLNFMGNEFGHPEWIDFPREGNNWSYQYCRRQWSLVDDKKLKYEFLNNFDRVMIRYAGVNKILKDEAHSLWIGQDDKVLIFERGDKIFAFNFNAKESFDGYFVPAKDGEWHVDFTTDDKDFGGQGRPAHQKYHAKSGGFQLYLPSRTAIVLGRGAKKISIQ